MRGPVIPWIVGAVLLLGSSVAAVAVLNATAFSASGFVTVYTDALARRDAAAALAVPGVAVSGLDDDALTGAALPGLADVRQIDDREISPGRHRVTVEWRSRSGSGTTEFDVERAGTRFLLFPDWRFASAPVARLEAHAQGDTRFRVGGQPVDAPSGRRVALLVPGAYRVDMDGPVAVAPAVDVDADRAGGTVAAELRARASDAFQDAVGRAVESALAACARKRALYPPGCPFGAEVTDRITTAPQWTIATEPTVRAEPTSTPGVWRATLSGGIAQVEVGVRSLYDGTVRTRTFDAPLRGAYRIVVDDDRPVVAGLVD